MVQRAFRNRRSQAKMENNRLKVTLTTLPVALRRLILGITLLLSSGVTVGLIYLYDTTSMSADGALSRYHGDEPMGEIDIPESYPKAYSDMLLTTHNHLLGFSFVFAILCTIFYFTTLLPPFWKNFLMIEPFLSVLVTFGSLWLVRFIHTDLIYLTIISAVFTYASYYLITGIIWYELLIKKNKTPGSPDRELK